MEGEGAGAEPGGGAYLLRGAIGPRAVGAPPAGSPHLGGALGGALLHTVAQVGEPAPVFGCHRQRG